MICLFLDTSQEDLIVALKKDNELIFNKNLKTKNDHSSYLVSIVRESIEKNNLKISDIDKILVTIGPGSFTGTRIGITVAKTLAYSLGIKVVPVSSLKQYIFEYDSYDYYIPIIEERNNNLYYAAYNSKYDEVMPETYTSKDNMFDNISNLEGKVLIISNENYEGYEVKERIVNTNNLISYYDRIEGENPHIIKPNYIKKIEVESKL